MSLGGFVFFELDFALGDFESEVFAVHATLAEPGEGLDESKESRGVLLKGLFQRREVDVSESVTDFKGGELLGGFVYGAIVVLAYQVEEQLELGTSIFAALLFLEPDEVTGAFPAEEVIFVQGFSEFAESGKNLEVGEALAEHLIDGLAGLRVEAADFVAGETGNGGEVARRLRKWSGRDFRRSRFAV